MMSAEERISRLHRRAGILKKQRDKKMLILYGSAGAVLTAVLSAIVIDCLGSAHSAVSGYMTGTSILSESVGGYVLVAVLSFMTAVVITVICIRLRQKKEAEAKEIQEVKDNTGKDEGR